jgi:hypothetical protein
LLRPLCLAAESVSQGLCSRILLPSAMAVPFSFHATKQPLWGIAYAR